MPYAVGALRGLRPSCRGWPSTTSGPCCWRQRLAARGIRVFTEPPHTNAFRVHVEREVDDLDERRVVAMEQRAGAALAAVVGLRRAGVVVDRARRGPRDDGVGRRRGGRDAACGSYVD